MTNIKKKAKHPGTKLGHFIDFLIMVHVKLGHTEKLSENVFRDSGTLCSKPSLVPHHPTLDPIENVVHDKVLVHHS